MSVEVKDDMMKRWFNSLSKRQKSLYSFLLVGIVLTLLIGVPTLANLIKALSSSGSLVWDGTTASSYAGGTGTSSDPYIISNGEELAYFQSQLVSNNYQNTHFALGANILLNEGIFDYDSSNGIMYILNGTTYYVNPFTKNYYPNPSRTGSPSGTINIFPSMPNFKGTFDGNSYTIYGAYVTSSSAYEVGLFTNLQGTIKNVQIANSMVYGGTVTGGVAGSTNGADLVNILFDGYVVGTGISQNLS
ncbi:MAG: hypothetical protein FWC41_13290, partial [Firmicutes bacterium]|nr:hypothetical protein [Bacillota bacterium]